MRWVQIVPHNLKLFDEELDEEDINYFRENEDVFNEMFTDLGNVYWKKALLTFRICILNYGFLTDVPPFIKKVYRIYYSKAITYMDGIFRLGEVEDAKQFIQDACLLQHHYYYTSQTGIDENPFFKNDSKEVFRKFFGNPEKESIVKMFCLLPIYLRFGAFICRVLKLWINSTEKVAPGNTSYCLLPQERKIFHIEVENDNFLTSGQQSGTDDEFISYIKKNFLERYKQAYVKLAVKQKPPSDELKSKCESLDIKSQNSEQATSHQNPLETNENPNLADSETVAKKKKKKKSKQKSGNSNSENDNDNEKDVDDLCQIEARQNTNSPTIRDVDIINEVLEKNKGNYVGKLSTKPHVSSGEESDESDDTDEETRKRHLRNENKPDMNIDQEIAKQLVKNIPSDFSLPKRGHSAILRPGECDDGMNMMLHFNTNPNDYEDHPNSKKDFTNAVTGLVQEMSSTPTKTSKKPPKFRPDMLGKSLNPSSKREQIKMRLRKKLQSKEPSKNYLQDLEGNLSFRTRIEPKDDEGPDLSSNSFLDPQIPLSEAEMRRLILERKRALENEKLSDSKCGRQSLNSKQKERAKLKEALFSTAADAEDAAMLEKIKSKGPPYEVKFKIEPCVKKVDSDGNEVTENLSAYLFDKMLKEREKEEEEREACMDKDESLVDKLDRQLIQVEEVKKEHSKVMKDIFSKMASGAQVGPNDRKLHDDPDLNAISHKVQDVFKDICGDGVDIVCVQNQSSPESSEDEFNFKSTREVIKELRKKQKEDTGEDEEPEWDNKIAAEYDNKMAKENENKIAAEKAAAAEKRRKAIAAEMDDRVTVIEKGVEADANARALAEDIKAILANQKEEEVVVIDPKVDIYDSRYYGASGNSREYFNTTGNSKDSDKKAKLKKCSKCNLIEPAPKTFKKCLKCREQGVKNSKYYCGKSCQATDWKERHKREHKENNFPKEP